jgi:hypothetical protein
MLTQILMQVVNILGIVFGFVLFLVGALVGIRGLMHGGTPIYFVLGLLLAISGVVLFGYCGGFGL